MNDTIAAPATAVGRAGIGIIRISGPHVREIAKALLGGLPKPRYATFGLFKDKLNCTLDEGLALFFPAPHSFTGEDVLELHGHGGVAVMDLLLKHILSLGARLARAGEFSERAFLNGKLDLTQAEAIADLINAGSAQAARAALQSLQGVFSQKIHALVERIIILRTFIEAALDFSEEEIDLLQDGQVLDQLKNLLLSLEEVQYEARQGALLHEGINIVIAGAPNAGKSSLLNQLSGRDTAIVTEIAGTTRDVLKESIQIDGIPLQIMDTAGLRESTDKVEQEGIRRAREEIFKADHILYLIDSSLGYEYEKVQEELMNHPRLTVVINKIDLMQEKPSLECNANVTTIKLSAKTGEGISLLKQHLKEMMGFSNVQETAFSARRRHLDALVRAKACIVHGQQQLIKNHAVELLAEDLRSAQQALNEITGEFTSEDLLGRIFQSFCIGK